MSEEYPHVGGPCDAEGYTSDQLAEFFHRQYEELAPKFGYKTRDASAVPWEEVPPQNKQLMREVCFRVLQEFFPEHLLIQ